MSAIASNIQREVLDHKDETLLKCVIVTTIARKKKIEYLCISSTLNSPHQFYLYRVYRSEKDSFKSKHCWPLSALKCVDAKEKSTSFEFELHFDKIYKWSTNKIIDKVEFLDCLYQISRNYQIEFLSMDSFKIKNEIMDPIFNIDKNFTHDGDLLLKDLIHFNSTDEEYQEITKVEEVDLKFILDQTNWTFSDSEVFVESLSTQLSKLDQQNIETIIKSEERIINLMLILDKAVSELEKMTDHLFECETLLEKARESISGVKMKDNYLDIDERNSLELYNLLNVIINQIYIDSQDEEYLLQNPIRSDNINDFVSLSYNILEKVNYQFPNGVSMLNGVDFQRVKLIKLKDNFSERLYNFFIKLIKDVAQIKFSITLNSQPCITPHTNFHSELVPFHDLIRWMKISQSDKSYYTSILYCYLKEFTLIYTEEIKSFFTELKRISSKNLDGKKLALMRSGNKPHPNYSNSIESINSISTNFKSPSTNLLSPTESIASNLSNLSGEITISPDESFKFENTYTLMLSQIGHISSKEQSFLMIFFDFSHSENTDLNSIYDDDVGQIMNQELKLCLVKLFESLQLELESFLNMIDKSIGIFQLLYILLHINSEVKTKSINPASMNYLEISLNNCLPLVQNNFDKSIQFIRKQIEELKSKKSKEGGNFVQSVRTFLNFLTSAQAMVNKFENPIIDFLERYYIYLIESVFKSIEKCASELHKLSSYVLRFENFHYLFLKLSEIKIPCLESWREEAKKRKTDSIDSYCNILLGRPMEKLSIFIDGVQAQLNQGVKPEEVGFKIEMSKAELKKCVSLYPEREVKKALDSLYKKIDKNLSQEIGLNQVIWHEVHSKFINEYNRISDTIKMCYPDAGIKLDFSLLQLLEFFSEVSSS